MQVRPWVVVSSESESARLKITTSCHNMVLGPPSSELQPILSLHAAALLEVLYSNLAASTNCKHPQT